MTSETYEIYEDGDVHLILENPRPPFASWNDNEAHEALPIPAPPAVNDFVVVAQPHSFSKKGRKKVRDRGVISPWDFILSVEVDEAGLERATCDAHMSQPTQSYDQSIRESDEGWESLRCINKACKNASLPVEITVSSHHLIAASPYFKRTLKGKFKEAQILHATGFLRQEIADVDADALIIILNIIHHKARSVPKAVSLEMLAKIAVIVDLYECHEALEPYVGPWVSNLGTQPPRTYSRETMLWLCISWVLRLSEQFEKVTCLLLRQSVGPLQDMGLPVPSITDRITEQRTKLFDNAFDVVRETVEKLSNGSWGCSNDCRCAHIGALVKALHVCGITISQPISPFHGFTLSGTISYLRSVRSPNLCQNLSKSCDDWDSKHVGEKCSLEAYMKPRLDRLDKMAHGLGLDAFLNATQEI